MTSSRHTHAVTGSGSFRSFCCLCQCVVLRLTVVWCCRLAVVMMLAQLAFSERNFILTSRISSSLMSSPSNSSRASLMLSEVLVRK